MTVTAELHDGRTLEFPDGTDPSVVQATVKRMLNIAPAPEKSLGEKIWNAGKEAVGSVVEPVAKMATGIVAKPISEVMGMSAAAHDYLTGQTGDAEGFKNHIANALTYEPTTEAGKSEYNPLNALPNAIGKGIDMIRPDAATGDQSTMAAMLRNGVREAIPQAIGLAGVKGAPAVVKGIKSAVLPVTQTVAARFGNKGAIQSRAAATLQSAAGDNLPFALRAMDNAQEFVPGAKPTMAEAIAGAQDPASIQGGRLVGLQRAYRGAKDVEDIIPSAEQAQKNALESSLAPYAGGATKVEQQLALDYAQALRENHARDNYGAVGNDVVSPASDAALLEQKIAEKEASRISALQNAGRMQTEAAQQRVLATGNRATDAQLIRQLPPGNIPRDPAIVNGTGVPAGAYPVPGSPRVPPRYAPNVGPAEQFAGTAQDAAEIAAQRGTEKNFLNYQLDALRKTVGPDAERNLFSIANRPSMEAALESAGATAAEKGIPFPTGVLDATGKPQNFTVNQLQLIKKALDGQLEARTAKVAVKGLDNVDTSAIANTRDQFVKFLEQKSPGWKNARNTYANDSIPINQMTVNQALADKLRNPSGNMTPAQFLSATDTGESALLKKAGVQPFVKSYEGLLTPDNMATIQGITDHLERGQKTNQMASAIQGVDAGTGLPGIPHIGRTAMLIDALRRSINGKNVNQAVATAMTDPKMVAELLRRPAFNTPGAVGQTIVAAPLVSQPRR